MTTDQRAAGVCVCKRGPCTRLASPTNAGLCNRCAAGLCDHASAELAGCDMSDTGLVLPGEFDHGRAMLPPHAAEVVSLFGFPYGADCHDSLWWRSSPDGSIVLFANCSDLFAWATSDGEEITETDMPLLRATFADLRQIDEEMYLNELFAARKRGKSPMPEFFRGDNRSIAVDALFIAAPTYEPIVCQHQWIRSTHNNFVCAKCQAPGGHNA